MEAAIHSAPKTRIAVVTGGNKGIGLEVCRQLAGDGATVVLTARDKTRGAAAAEKLREAGLYNVIFHELEITDAASIAHLAEFLRTRFGKLDILINNAAIGAVEYVLDPVDSSTAEFSGMDKRQRLERMFQGVRETYEAAIEGVKTNYDGTKHVIEALLPLLLASSDGRVVNASSEFGLLRLIKNEELKQEQNDVEKLTEERLDEVLAMYLRDFEAGEVEAQGWPMGFSAYKVAKVAMNALLEDPSKKAPGAAHQLRAPWVREHRHDHPHRTPDAGGRRDQHGDGGAAAGRRADRRILRRWESKRPLCDK